MFPYQYQPKFKKGFNNGYLIALHMPDLADMVVKTKARNPYIEGFRSGRRQYILEQRQKSGSDWLKSATGMPVPNQILINKNIEPKI